MQLSESDKVQLGRVPVAKQRPAQRVFSVIWELEAEVNNGGFHQYFLNIAGDGARFAPEALRQIGAARMAEIVVRALAVFPEAVPTNLEERRRAVAAASDDQKSTWAALDDEFLEYPEDLTTLLYAFVREHDDEFGDVE